MRERPIPFSAPMVRAILAGTKTQTRRALKPDLFISSGGAVVRMKAAAVAGVTGISEVPCPYGQPGDRLWVREAWRVSSAHDALPPRDVPPNVGRSYEADAENRGMHMLGKIRPGMFMPRWASRITLEVTGVRVERLRDISEADAMAEGITYHAGLEGWHTEEGRHFHCVDPRESYAGLWESINGPGSWDASPWVWVVEFRRI